MNIFKEVLYKYENIQKDNTEYKLRHVYKHFHKLSLQLMLSIKNLTGKFSLDINHLIPASFSCIERNLDIQNEPQIKRKCGPKLVFYNSPHSSRVTPKIASSSCTIAAPVWRSSLLISPTWKLNLPYFILPKKECNQETLKICKIYSMRYEVHIAMNISDYCHMGCASK
jgi:hypothetical protein